MCLYIPKAMRVHSIGCSLFSTILRSVCITDITLAFFSHWRVYCVVSAKHWESKYSSVVNCMKSEYAFVRAMRVCCCFGAAVAVVALTAILANSMLRVGKSISFSFGNNIHTNGREKCIATWWMNGDETKGSVMLTTHYTHTVCALYHTHRLGRRYKLKYLNTNLKMGFPFDERARFVYSLSCSFVCCVVVFFLRARFGALCFFYAIGLLIHSIALSLSRIHIFYSSACFATAHLSISKLICHLRALHFMYVFHIICNVISSVIEWDAKLLYVCVVVVIVIVIVHGFENEAKFDFCYWQMNCSNTIWNILISIH